MNRGYCHYMGNLWQIAQKINTEQCSVALGEPMRVHTTFRIGGPADLYVKPRSLRALAEALDRLRDSGLPVFLLGGGANILVGDGGIRGAVIDTGLVSSIYPVPDQGRGQVLLYAECGAAVSLLCEEALARGLSGLENFYGMPGSVGGAIHMNARCYEDDISSHIDEIRYIDAVGSLQKAAAASPWSYKRFFHGGRELGRLDSEPPPSYSCPTIPGQSRGACAHGWRTACRSTTSITRAQALYSKTTGHSANPQAKFCTSSACAGTESATPRFRRAREHLHQSGGCDGPRHAGAHRARSGRGARGDGMAARTGSAVRGRILSSVFLQGFHCIPRTDALHSSIDECNS